MTARAFVRMAHARVPLTPLDEAWSVDGRVYARFDGGTRFLPVGTMSNAEEIPDSIVRLTVVASGSPDRVPVKVGQPVDVADAPQHLTNRGTVK